MKLTQEQINVIKSSWGDWEGVHGTYDEIMCERLKQLDPEFVAHLDEVTKGATFWYA